MRTDIAQRLIDHRVLKENGCWESTYCRTHNGYATMGIDGRTRVCHRVAYELWIGPVPDGLELDHLCRNRGCWNPEHLEPVTHSENMFRGNSSKNGSTGIRGVKQRRKRWIAYCGDSSNKQNYLGCFTSKEDAIEARNRAMEARKL